MIYILFTSALAYAAAILFLRRGLYRIERDTEAAPQSVGDNNNNIDNNNLKYSVVIAARNEAGNIEGCLRCALAQDMPSTRYEIIVINDRSEDATLDILNGIQQQAGADRLKIISIDKTPSGMAPKKYAVSRGVGMAAGEIIVFTDADCRVPRTWLSSIDRHFTPDTGLVQGITSYKYIPGMSKSFFGLQATDFLSHGVVAAAAIGADLPINSNANNFAFRKAAFEDVGGYGDGGRIVSGDDDYMLQKIWKSGRGKWRIRFMADPAGSVDTAPTETVRDVFEQRKRWGSKTVHYHAGQVALLSAAFIFYVLTIAAAGIAVIIPSYLPIAASMLFVKLSGEMVLMIPGTRLFNKTPLRKYIIPASLIQLPMVVAAVLFGVFGKFEWKGKVSGRVVE